MRDTKSVLIPGPSRFFLFYFAEQLGLNTGDQVAPGSNDNESVSKYAYRVMFFRSKLKLYAVAVELGKLDCGLLFSCFLTEIDGWLSGPQTHRRCHTSVSAPSYVFTAGGMKPQ